MKLIKIEDTAKQDHHLAIPYIVEIYTTADPVHTVVVTVNSIIKTYTPIEEILDEVYYNQYIVDAVNKL